ncbi:707_t:CDS:1, partial [Scutellospora calospora]
PDKWKTYLTAWKRVEGNLKVNNPWPWNLDAINLSGNNGNEYTVKKGTVFLKNKYTQLTASQKNRDPEMVDA